MTDSFYIVYIFVGFLYWGINVFVRDLPSKNEEGEGWILAPTWFLLWPICILAMIVGWGVDVLKNRF